ncbi:hypothetical protein WMY93_012627 [Mugilogobius chulae]|uniref:BED-type domain-containing protein n=1 Tax=Mugilogobius chulae TaxID=88201 RepID=A0AAW0P447_9GOBI
MDLDQEDTSLGNEGRNAFIAWKFKNYFVLKQERERNITVQCKLCLPTTNLLAASRDSTSNLKKHLKRKHPSVLLQCPETSSDESTSSTPPPLKQATLGIQTVSQKD